MNNTNNVRNEDPDPVIFGLPDPVLFSFDPDPTCNNGFIKLFSSGSTYKPELKIQALSVGL